MSNLDSAAPRVRIEGLAKAFRLHPPDREATDIPVFANLDLEVRPGECVVLAGASGVGKSTLMRSIFGNYLPTAGRVLVRHDGDWVDVAAAPPRRLLEVRRRTLGYVSQFLRVIPRVSTLDLVKEPLLGNGVDDAAAEERAVVLLRKLPPATFSGGEQQRVNLAGSFVSERPVMLLDEPTASLDAGNRGTVVDLIREALGAGVAMIGIFHDEDVRARVATRLFDVESCRVAA